jgi:hypothetical protein
MQSLERGVQFIPADMAIESVVKPGQRHARFAGHFQLGLHPFRNRITQGVSENEFR